MERMQVARYRSLRDRVHEGPLYTVLGDNVRVGKHGNVQIDPFEGMPTYGMKYMKKPRKIPRLDTRPYVLKFFPKELWSTLDPEHATTNGVATSSKKKRLLISTSNKSNGIDGRSGDEGEEGEGADRRKGAIDSALNGEDDEEEGEKNPEEEVPEEEEVDEDYEEDEDDMGGDYNAEQYFDDGGDDAGDDYDGGDDGGGGDFY